MHEMWRNPKNTTCNSFEMLHNFRITFYEYKMNGLSHSHTAYFSESVPVSEIEYFPAIQYAKNRTPK